MCSSALRIVFFTYLFRYGSLSSLGNSDLVIYAPGKTTPRRIEEIVNGTLELTCKLLQKNVTVPIALLDWRLPAHNKVRPTKSKVGNDSIKLTIAQLHVNDSGEYVCAGNVNNEEPLLLKPIQLYVRQRNLEHCQDHHFECAPGICIHKRYVCDGHNDCQNDLDESIAECGPNACLNKLLCYDGRCIPKSWCCEAGINSNCTNTHPHPCCPVQKPPGYPYPHGPHYNNQASLLQGTMYTIIGFTMVFMSVVAILMIAICRVHVQRGAVGRNPRPTAPPPPIYSPPLAPPYSSVELLPPPYAPPPYSDTPPPPYHSQDDASETSPCLPPPFDSCIEKIIVQSSS